jgi:hypothetical protein
VLYLKRPTSEDLWFRCAVKGRFRYSDLKEAAPGDYGICIWMSRFVTEVTSLDSRRMASQARRPARAAIGDLSNLPNPTALWECLETDSSGQKRAVLRDPTE